ncbi:MAG: hypothetical protein ACREIA_12285, partial [Opitutaceae bacterium]
MTFDTSRFSRRPWKAAALCAGVLSGALFAIAGAKADSETPKAPVEVQVDKAPLPRGSDNAFSFSPIVQKVGPSVVKVVVRSEGKEIEAPQLGLPFDDPMLRRFFGPMIPNQRGNGSLRTPPSAGLGSGVVVSSDG